MITGAGWLSAPVHRQRYGCPVRRSSRQRPGRRYRQGRPIAAQPRMSRNVTALDTTAGRQIRVRDERVERRRAASRRRSATHVRSGRALPEPARDGRRVAVRRQPYAARRPRRWPQPRDAEILDHLVEPHQRPRGRLAQKCQRSGDRPVADASRRDEHRAAELECAARAVISAPLRARRLDHDRRVAERRDDPIAPRKRARFALAVGWYSLITRAAAGDDLVAQPRMGSRARDQSWPPPITPTVRASRSTIAA